MDTLRLSRRGLVFGAMASLAACAGPVSGPGMFNGLGSDYMSVLVIYRTDNRPVSWQDYQLVQGIARRMNLTLMGQLSTAFEAAGSGMLAYGMAGAAGGAAQGAFYAGAAPAGAAVSGLVYAFGGAVTGATTFAYGRDFDLSQMVETSLRDAARHDHLVEAERLHVVAGFVRTLNQVNSPAASLRKEMPDFHGPIAGSASPTPYPYAAAESRMNRFPHRVPGSTALPPLPPPTQLTPSQRALITRGVEQSLHGR